MPRDPELAGVPLPGCGEHRGEPVIQLRSWCVSALDGVTVAGVGVDDLTDLAAVPADGPDHLERTFNGDDGVLRPVYHAERQSRQRLCAQRVSAAAHRR